MSCRKRELEFIYAYMDAVCEVCLCAYVSACMCVGELYSGM